MLNTGKIYLHKILGVTLCWTLWEDLFTQNTEEKCMFEHCGKIYLNKIPRNTVCWTLWEDLFTQNTEEYTVCWALWEDLFTQKTGDYFLLNTVGKFMYTKYWELLYVQHCGKIYLHKILRNTVCWTLWEDVLTQNTEE